MGEKKKCDCNYCQFSNLRTEALESDDINVVKNALEAFADNWLDISQDLDYHKCILDGRWSTAEEILTRSLKKAKEHNSKG